MAIPLPFSPERLIQLRQLALEKLQELILDVIAYVYSLPTPKRVNKDVRKLATALPLLAHVRFVRHRILATSLRAISVRL